MGLRAKTARVLRAGEELEIAIDDVRVAHRIVRRVKRYGRWRGG